MDEKKQMFRPFGLLIGGIASSPLGNSSDEMLMANWAGRIGRPNRKGNMNSSDTRLIAADFFPPFLKSAYVQVEPK